MMTSARDQGPVGPAWRVAIFVALAGCSPSTQSDGGAPQGVDGGSSTGGPGTPPTQTGNATVDRLGAAAATCGQQSMFTVPGGWQMLAVGDKGCVVWVPPGWSISGAFTGIATAMEDASGREGFIGVAGATQEVSCTPADIRDSLLSGYPEHGYSQPQVLWHVELSSDFGGTSWPTGHTVFAMSVAGESLVGYLWLLTTQTVIACDVVGLGFWEPVASVDGDTCTLTQIINSVKCPSGGGACDDDDCDTQCKGSGHAGGACDAGGDCQCY